MKGTTINQVFSYLIFWGISRSCLWHFPVGCSFASSLIRFSHRNVAGNEEHIVGLLVFQLSFWDSARVPQQHAVKCLKRKIITFAARIQSSVFLDVMQWTVLLFTVLSYMTPKSSCAFFLANASTGGITQICTVLRYSRVWYNCSTVSTASDPREGTLVK